MNGFHYVYMLSDVATHAHHYVGIAQDLQARLARLNAGNVPHTSKFKPWVIDAVIAVKGKDVALNLERYLKTGSGRAFAVKHFFGVHKS